MVRLAIKYIVWPLLKRKISYEERVVKPSAPWSWIMPYDPIPFMHQPRFESRPIHGDLPSMIIASGRRTVAYVKYLKCKKS